MRVSMTMATVSVIASSELLPALDARKAARRLTNGAADTHTHTCVQARARGTESAVLQVDIK